MWVGNPALICEAFESGRAKFEKAIINNCWTHYGWLAKEAFNLPMLIKSGRVILGLKKLKGKGKNSNM